jgi:beta-N-acetylhexosaminidase
MSNKKTPSRLLHNSKDSPYIPFSPGFEVDSAQPSPPRRKRRRLNPQLTIILVALVILLVGSAVIGQRYLNTINHGVTKNSTTKNKTTVNNLQTVPGNSGNAVFAQHIYSSQQIDEFLQQTAHMRYKQLAALYVSRMSLDQEIGQLIMVEYQESSYSPALDTMIHDLHAGGVIMYQRQINTYNQTRQDTAHMQSRADFPLIISADEEGWNVHRLTNIYPPRLSAYDINHSHSTTVASQQGAKVAHDLLSLGLNTNFAPDVDVSTDDNYIGYDQRSFGSTPQDVIKYVGPYTKAMQSDGVIATMKHFPGLGSAPRSTDPHAVFVTIPHTKQQVYNIDLVPFNHFIHASDPAEQPGIIMSTDELVPALDPTYIAELSPTIMTTVLRQQLGYDGVAITDALTMLGVQLNGQHLSLPQAAVQSLKAGNDMLLGPGDPDSMQSVIAAIKTALQNGTLSKARLDEAATRIITLKMERHLVPAIPPQD